MDTSSAILADSALLPVAVKSLCLSQAPPFDLYVQHGEDGPLRLYRRRDYPISQDDLTRLAEGGIDTLYISTSDSKIYREYLLDNVLEDESIPAVKRYENLRATAQAVLVEAMRRKDVDGIVGITTALSDKLVTTVCESSVLLGDLFEVMTHDYSTFTHIMNVSTYSILLANDFGIRDKQQLVDIGKGALLHDIGKLEVSRETLTKPGRLTRAERDVLRQHPTRGFRKLSFRDDLDCGQLMMIYQHHERCDGRGYPVGLVGKEIHVWARICAIVDVFDALTHERHYRSALSLADVLEYFDVQAGRAFDEEMVHCLIAAVKKQM